MSQENALKGKDSIISYCSWCLTKSEHKFVKHTRFSRDIYECCNCHKQTQRCKFPNCECMTRGAPLQKQAESWWENIKRSWNSVLCAEHKHSIPSWDKIHLRIDTPDKFGEIWQKGKKWDKVKIASEAAVYAAIALKVIGKICQQRTPSKNALISSQKHKLADENASVKKLAQQAGGIAMGGGLALAIFQNFFGELKKFDITCIHNGDMTKPALLFINGFLQEDKGVEDWLEAVKDKFPDNPKYHVKWDSHVGIDLLKFPVKLAAECACSKKACMDFVRNPWHTAFNNAEKAGRQLAYILARTTAHKKYIIMGHSLGCRVAFYTAKELRFQQERRIDSLYLLSGAIGAEDWEEISENVNNIYNFYAKNDYIIEKMYKASLMGRAEEAIGSTEISDKADNIHNFDVTDLLHENKKDIVEDNNKSHLQKTPNKIFEKLKDKFPYKEKIHDLSNPCLEKIHDFSENWQIHMRYKGVFGEILEKYNLPYKKMTE